jgi:hypothetical protein
LEMGEKRRCIGARPVGGPTSRRAGHARTDRGSSEAGANRAEEGTACFGGV